jgi:hypothetical protein
LTPHPDSLRSSAGENKGSFHGTTFALHGYGVMNYFNYSWETDPSRRNTIDIERLVLYPSVRLTPAVGVFAEIEYEHGGTGASMEFDRFEEFGEYEMEIDKGGSVELDQLHVQCTLSGQINFRIGRIKLPVGLVSTHHEPSEYFSTTRSEMETALIPSAWYENGIELFGSMGARSELQYHLLLVNGLDATGFSSANWVVNGHQSRFEMVNAENLAVVAGVRYMFSPSTFVAGSAYYGNSSDNRPKPDLDAPAHVGVYELHAAGEWTGVTIRAMGLYGTLENADLVSAANRNLSNNLNVKRTPVGSAAAGYFVEAGYNVLHPLHADSVGLIVFVRWEAYDSMAKVAGDVFDNPRWERRVITAGVNVVPFDGLIFKGQYSRRQLGIPDRNIETTVSVGIGFEFD